MRCLTFNTGKFQFLVTTNHIPEIKNTAGMQMYCHETNLTSSVPSTRPCPLTNLSSPPGSSLTVQTRLELDRALEQYFQHGLAPTTWRTYGSAQKRSSIYHSVHSIISHPFHPQNIFQYANLPLFWLCLAYGHPLSNVTCLLSDDFTLHQ